MRTSGRGGGARVQQPRKRSDGDQQEDDGDGKRKPGRGRGGRKPTPQKRKPRKKFQGAARRLDEGGQEAVVWSFHEGALPVERKLVGIYGSAAEANAAARAAFYSDANPFGDSEDALEAAGVLVASEEEDGLRTLTAAAPPGSGKLSWIVQAAWVGGG